MYSKQAIGRSLLELADALEGRTGGQQPRTRIGLTLSPNETGPAELIRGACLAVQADPRLEVVLIGPPDSGRELAAEVGLAHVSTAAGERDIHQAMERLLAERAIAAAVTMHYSFPTGTATVGRAITPGRGREVFLATTTGTMDADRVRAMIKAAIAGIACAKACGIIQPTVGILNLDGARACERGLLALKERGYPIRFASSLRADGGAALRGNDLLAGACDVVVCDSLTGNVLMKILSAYTTGGDYESLGYGYGPGIGAGYPHLVAILSRASGAPVVAGAIRYAAQAVRGELLARYRQEMEQASAAGLDRLLARGERTAYAAPEAPLPAARAVTAEIAGLDILELEAAVQALLSAGIFARSGMGCTGPVVLVAEDDAERARRLLAEQGYV